MQTSDVLLPALHDAERLLAMIRERYAEALAACPVLERRLERHLPDVWRAYRSLYPQPTPRRFSA